MNVLDTYLCGIHLHSPLMSASGCFGYGTEYAAVFDPNILGAAVLKGVTLESRTGNEGVRIAETASGMLNCVGLENPGFDVFVKDILPSVRRSVHIPLIANINGKTVEEYEQLAARFEDVPDIAALELNISCPNVKEGGMAFGTNPAETARTVRRVKAVCTKPLIVKLSPNVTDIRIIAQAAEDEGADALSLINTIAGMAIDTASQKPLLGNVYGGLSGPAVKPVALKMVYDVAQHSALPIIGMGGIQNAHDAVEFILAGASALAIGSAFFKNPLAACEIGEGIRRYLTERGIGLFELIGKSHPDDGVSYRERLKKTAHVL